MRHDPHKPHPLYTGGEPVDPNDIIHVNDELGDEVKVPVRFKIVKPTDKVTGELRDQSNDAADNMRYAATLGLPTLKRRPLPRLGRAIIIGGAPSVRDNLDKVKELAKDPLNTIFAVNWSHTWLLKQGIVPNHCVFFEIDPEPDSVILQPHPDITYYICCHCHRKTFDTLKNNKRVLWHTYPNSDIEKKVNEELFPTAELVGGGIGTFTRTLTVALFLGYRHLDLFGCDSSFPDISDTTHVKGYETESNPNEDGVWVYAKNDRTGEVRRFRTTGPLALQHEEFKEYCLMNHAYYSMQIHGDSLLRYTHQAMWPANYSDSDDLYLAK